MSVSPPATSSRHGNLQKHQNQNKAQQLLIGHFHRRIGALIKQTGHQRMLDAGCGEGFVYHDLQSQGLTLDYTGADFSFEALKWGRANLIPDLRGQVADIHHLPFADNSFPLVICLEVLEHIPDSAVGLRELLRVSSSDVIISCPHEPFFRGINFLRGKHWARWGNDPEHLHTYSGRAYRAMIAPWAEIVWHGYSFPWQIAWLRK